MDLQPVERRSLSDAVFDQLSGEILAGSLAPGDALPSERRLCELLQVNRGAVREGLKRLRQAVAQELHAQGARDAPSSPETSSAPHTNTADAGKNAANSGGVAAALFSVDNVRAIEAACLMMAGLAAGLLLSRSL